MTCSTYNQYTFIFVSVIQSFISGFGSSKSIKKPNTKVTSGPSNKVPSGRRKIRSENKLL